LKILRLSSIQEIENVGFQSMRSKNAMAISI